MAGTGIRQLAFGIGAALLLAGCEAASTGGNGDPGAAALASADISTVSLDSPDATATPGDDAAVAAGPLVDPLVVPAERPAAPARRGLFGFLKPKTADSTDSLAGDPSLAEVAALPAAQTGEGEALAEARVVAADTTVPVTDAAADLAADAPAADAAPVRERKGLFGFLKARPADGSTTTAAATATPTRPSVRMIDRDVEAPDVFQVTDSGLWDGRPSLGGVWVAYSDVRDPERVIIRNMETGAFVIGALFRRERENPGPRLQVSSDAADALGMLAGAPAKLNVTALRREEVVDPADAEALLGSGGAIAETTVDPIAESAAAAIAAAPEPEPASGDLSAAAPEVRPAAEPAAKPVAKAAAQPAAAGVKPFLQVGIFSVETNAEGTARSLEAAGLTAQVIREESQGKTYWRVIAGPAGTGAERDALLAKAKGLGFGDAYFVSG